MVNGGCALLTFVKTRWVRVAYLCENPVGALRLPTLRNLAGALRLPALR